MNEIFCHICNNPSPFLLRKGIADYFQCESCRTVFCAELDNSEMIGGLWEKERAEQNSIRIDRMNTMTEGMKKEDVFIMNFGCGNNLLGKDLIDAGYVNTFAYDAYNDEYRKLPEKDKYHIVVAVEVVEHLAPNYIEFDVIHRCLKNNGLLYTETGFTNIADRDGIDLKDFLYVAPEAGHSTIFSHHGYDLLLSRKGFVPRRHFDANCRLHMKINK